MTDQVAEQIQKLQAHVTELTQRLQVVEKFIAIQFGTANASTINNQAITGGGNRQYTSDPRRTEAGMGPIIGGSTYE